MENVKRVYFWLIKVCLMQHQMPINALSLMTNPLKDVAVNLCTRMDNFWKLYNDGQMLADLIRYTRIS